MRTIPLITGESIPADQMGFCSAHEHIIPGKGFPPEKRAEVIEYSRKRLEKAYSLGVRTIVDVSPSVDIELLREVVEPTKMQVVGCTGFYLGLNGIYDGKTVDEFADHMLEEAKYGIEKTGIMPGVIKVATANPVLEEWEVRVLTAAGLVQKETGLPLCVHSVTGLQHQAPVLEQAGADMSRVYFCHVEANQGWEGRSFDEEIRLMERVLEKGSRFAFNNFNNWTHTPESCMAKLIKTLARDGFADRMMATMDFLWFYQNDKPCVLWEDICSDSDQRDYGYLISHVIPWMRSQGIDEGLIHAMNHENPAGFFA